MVTVTRYVSGDLRPERVKAPTSPLASVVVAASPSFPLAATDAPPSGVLPSVTRPTITEAPVGLTSAATWSAALFTPRNSTAPHRPSASRMARRVSIALGIHGFWMNVPSASVGGAGAATDRTVRMRGAGAPRKGRFPRATMAAR